MRLGNNTHQMKRPNTMRQVALLVILALVLYAIVPQLSGFSDSLESARTADSLQLICSTIAVLASYLFAALTYRLLAGRRLVYGITFIVQMAATFINRLLPAGIGGMGVNFVYLRHRKLSQGAAASVVAVNNLLGVIGHSLLLGFTFLVLHTELPYETYLPSPPIVLTGVAALALLATLLHVAGLNKRFKKLFEQSAKQLRHYRKNPIVLFASLGSSIALTLSVCTAFYLCTLAVGISLSFAVVFIVFTLGFAIGGATPTPGGLGGVEAGLVLGLVAYDVNRADALAAVLIFRLISFWLPTFVGLIFFIYAQRKNYI